MSYSCSKVENKFYSIDNASTSYRDKINLQSNNILINVQQKIKTFNMLTHHFTTTITFTTQTRESHHNAHAFHAENVILGCTKQAVERDQNHWKSCLVMTSLNS